MSKIIVTSNCLMRGQHYDAGQIVDCDKMLTGDFIVLERGRLATEEDIAAAKKSSKRDSAAPAV